MYCVLLFLLHWSRQPLYIVPCYTLSFFFLYILKIIKSEFTEQIVKNIQVIWNSTYVLKHMQFWCWHVSVFLYLIPFPSYMCVCFSNKKKRKQKTNFRLWLPLLHCNSIDIDQHTVFQTNNITKKGNPKGSEKIELCLFSATAKTEKHCSSFATTGNSKAI